LKNRPATLFTEFSDNSCSVAFIKQFALSAPADNMHEHHQHKSFVIFKKYGQWFIGGIWCIAVANKTMTTACVGHKLDLIK
jgi:hypothetical protein